MSVGKTMFTMRVLANAPSAEKRRDYSNIKTYIPDASKEKYAKQQNKKDNKGLKQLEYVDAIQIESKLRGSSTYTTERMEGMCIERDIDKEKTKQLRRELRAAKYCCPNVVDMDNNKTYYKVVKLDHRRIYFYKWLTKEGVKEIMCRYGTDSIFGLHMAEDGKITRTVIGTSKAEGNRYFARKPKGKMQIQGNGFRELYECPTVEEIEGLG